MMGHHHDDGHGQRTQLELVGVQRVGDAAVIDAIEVGPTSSIEVDSLVTLQFSAAPSSDGADSELEQLVEVLAGWVDSPALCEVYEIGTSGAATTLAFLQDSQLLVIGTTMDGP
jgi:hypothetical protein